MKQILTFIIFFYSYPAYVQEQPSLLWKISGNGLKNESYLFGTIHINDSSVFTFDSIVFQCFDKCNAYAMELKIDEVSAKKLEREVYMKNTKLSDLLSETELKLINDKFMQYNGISIFLFEKMKPFYLLTQAMAGTLKKSNYPPLDLFFDERARKQGKERIGIEKMKEQTKIVNSIPINIQAALLYQWAKDADYEAKETDKLILAYLNSDFNKIQTLLDEPGLPDKTKNALIDERNHKMAKRISRIARKQSVFAAVGAAHLIGDSGVVNLLRNMKYTVKPIYFNFSHDNK